MVKNKPRVSIGLPVFNGERFVGEAIDSILRQTFDDFELIISDNASTDGTEEICRTYARNDSRVRYYREDKNKGAAINFNHVFALSSGYYFKWVAADDPIAPTYLERCVEVLDQDPSVIVSHCKITIIDENSEHIKDYDDLLDFQSLSPRDRFRKYLFRQAGMWNAIYGVIRSDVLGCIAPLGGHRGADQVLLGELVLRGKIFQVPERLGTRRWHAEQSWRTNPTNKANAIWYDTDNKNKIVLPKRPKLFIEYLRMIKRVQMQGGEKIACYLYITRWGAKYVLWSPFKKYVTRQIEKFSTMVAKPRSN